VRLRRGNFAVAIVPVAAYGRTVFVGFTVSNVAISATKSVGAAILTHGKVKESRLPFAIAAAAKADAPLIRFV